MSRWICVDDICIPSDENDWEELVAFADAIAEQEPIDIVRCGECKHCFICGYRHGMNVYECRISQMRMYDTSNHFCSYGCREEE